MGGGHDAPPASDRGREWACAAAATAAVRRADCRQAATEDPELFAAYRILAADSQSIAVAHVEEIIDLAATIIRAGVDAGAFRAVNAAAVARAILVATSRFHHPAHSAEWLDPAVDAAYDDVWRLLTTGL